MSKVRPPYPAQFRQQMVELVRAGRSPAELSRVARHRVEAGANAFGLVICATCRLELGLEAQLHSPDACHFAAYQRAQRGSQQTRA